MKVPWGGFLAMFLKAGNLTFGGGSPTIAVLQREAIGAREWLPKREFGLLYGISRLTPGTNVLAFIAAMGYRLRGWSGAIAGVVAASAPSAALLTAMAVTFELWSGNPWVKAAMHGAITGVIGLVLASAWQLLEVHAGWKKSGAFAAAAFTLSYMDWLTPLTVLLLAGAAGAWVFSE